MNYWDISMRQDLLNSREKRFNFSIVYVCTCIIKILFCIIPVVLTSFTEINYYISHKSLFVYLENNINLRVYIFVHVDSYIKYVVVQNNINKESNTQN